MPLPAPTNSNMNANPGQAVAELQRQAALGNRRAIVALAQVKRMAEMQADGAQGLPQPAVAPAPTALDDLAAPLATPMALAGAPAALPTEPPLNFGFSPPAVGPGGEPLAAAMPLPMPGRRPAMPMPAPAQQPLGPSRGGAGAPRRMLDDRQLESTAADAGPGLTPPGQPGPSRRSIPIPGAQSENSRFFNNLLRFGLTTMAAGAQPGASLMSSLGAGGMAALQGADAQRLAEAEAQRRARDEARDERRLALDEAKAGRSDPQSAIAKARLDLRNGLITEDEFRQIRAYEGGRTKAPPTRTVRIGSELVSQEWNGEGWAEIGRGPAWNPNAAAGGGPTLTQTANNAEVDAARRTLTGLSREEILRRTQQATATGRENPDFDPQLERLVRVATQRKVGEDADFESTWQRLLGSGDGSNGSGAGETVSIDGFDYEVLQRNPDGTIEIRDPETGQVGTWAPGG